MRKIIISLIALGIGLAMQGCCGCGKVSYNDVTNDMQYKPESDWSYVKYLGPEELPEDK